MSKAKKPTAAPKPVRRYVRETVPTPLTPPENEFAASVRQLKAARDTYILDLARLIEKEEARVGAADTNKILKEECIASSDVERAKALLDLPPRARQVAQELTDEHAIAAVRAKQLSPSTRTRWLQRAKERGLTAYELQVSIAHGRVVTMKGIFARNGHNSGILTIEGITFDLEMWSNQGKRDGQLKGFNQEQKEKLSEELRRLEQCIAEVRSEARLCLGETVASRSKDHYAAASIGTMLTASLAGRMAQ